MRARLGWIVGAALLASPMMALAQKAESKETLTSANDRKFVEKAASAGMAEVKLGKLAMEKGTAPEVKAYGKRMVEDHSKANDELKTLATRKSFPLPTEVTAEHKATYDKLAKLSGKDFDKAYLEAMAKDHDDVVMDFKKQAATGSDPELKQWANKTLPVLEQHDHLAHQDQKAVK